MNKTNVSSLELPLGLVAINFIFCTFFPNFYKSIIFNILLFNFRPDLEPIDLQLDYWTADGSSSGPGGTSGPGAPGSTSGGLTSSVSSMSTGGKGRNADHSSSRTDSKRGKQK